MSDYPIKKYEDLRKLFINSTRPYKPENGRGSWSKRLDDSGKVISFKDYAKKKSTGWEIDHENPKSNGGSNDDTNLRALNTTKNRQKGGKTKDPYAEGRKKREKQQEKVKKPKKKDTK